MDILKIPGKGVLINGQLLSEANSSREAMENAIGVLKGASLAGLDPSQMTALTALQIQSDLKRSEKIQNQLIMNGLLERSASVIKELGGSVEITITEREGDDE